MLGAEAERCRGVVTGRAKGNDVPELCARERISGETAV